MKPFITILLTIISLPLFAQWNCNFADFTFDNIKTLNVIGDYPAINVATTSPDDHFVILRLDAYSQALEISTNAANLFSQINSNREIQIVTSNNNANILIRPDGTGETQIVGKLTITTHTPSSSTDTGTTGQISWDGSYIYVCIAPNTWMRSDLNTW